MKRKHAGAQTRKHGCERCGMHKSIVLPFTRKTGSKYVLCEPCARATGRVDPRDPLAFGEFGDGGAK
jgi:hypothetical protein